MRLMRILFLFFIGLCALVSIMIVQTLYLQAEGAVHENRSSAFAQTFNKIRYYLFLPRTKLQLFIRNLRNRYKGSPVTISEPDPNRAEQISDIIAEMVSQKEYVQYLVLVITAPGKKDIRSLIRNEGYWAYNWTDSEGVPINWKHYFVVGQNEDANVNAAVLEEAKQFGDILVGNFEDSYKNLVFKSLWLIEWAVNRYDFDTMVKCDDDTIINMSKYHELMKQQDLSVPFFGGVRFGGMPVFRHGRYEVKPEEWAPDKFSPYCSGGGYTLNPQAIHKFLDVHYSGVQPVFLVEDAFMGTLAYHAQINPVALNGHFRAFSPHAHCTDPKLTLAHYVKDVYQREFMKNFRTTGRFCDEQHVQQWKLDHPKKPKKKKT
ncbi:hypothetical protein ACHWQZ_G014801 [Mnemiopsis leidyi]